jgi:hypothetical protein
MTFQTLRTPAIAALIFAMALPLAAQQPHRRRSSKSTAQVASEVTITGTITDASTGAPVIQAAVLAAGRKANTNNQGQFTLKITATPPIHLEISRSGYQTATRELTPGGPTATLNATLQGNPTVRVRTTAGQTYELDLETSQFAYVVPLSGYIKSDAGNFCRENGTAYAPDKSELKRVIGPGVLATNASCCPTGPVIRTEVETKTGDRIPVFWNDSCLGSEVDFLGRDHVTAQFVFLKVTDIAEVTFP